MRRLTSPGVWQPRYHEDQPERIPGPELRDYAGLPINENARQFADSWDPSPHHASRRAVSRARFAVHLSWPDEPAGLGGTRSENTGFHRASKHYISTYEQTRTIYMDGRPHPGPNAERTPGWDSGPGTTRGDMLVIETTHHQTGLGAPQRVADER